MKVLFLCDDVWHPSEVLERGLMQMDQEDITFDIVRTAKDIVTPAMLRRYDVTVIAKGNAVNAANSAPWFEPGVTECGPEEFAAYVREGGGLLAVHAALSVGRDQAPAYTDLVGCYFLGHPLREVTHVKITEQNAITQGVEDFSERDEPYQIAVTAADAKIFMTTQSAHGGTFPSGYTRLLGEGRLAAITPGHTLAVWENPHFQRLFKNAIRWCAER